MIWHGNLFILRLYRTENECLEMVGRHSMGFVIGKNLRMPSMVDNKRYDLQGRVPLNVSNL